MEKYKYIKGYEGSYQVSNHGNVRSLYSFKVLKPRIERNGYVRVRLYKDNKSKDFLVHRLVCLHFIDNPENKETVNHINGIKTDNRAENLEWATGSENLLHAFSTGLKSPTGVAVKSEFKNGAHLKKQVTQLSIEGNVIRVWDSGAEAARIMGFKKESIYMCVCGKRKMAGGFKWSRN